MATSFLEIKCTKCGSAAEYDVVNQYYKCKACGNSFEAVEVVNTFNKWREDKKETTNNELRSLSFSVCQCPNCGSRFFFKVDEFTGKCPYCDTAMVRKEFEESDSFPELIIPFVLTENEAKERLLDWIEKNKNKKEAKLVKNNIKSLKGYYLPYCLIKGPIDYLVSLNGLSNHFSCKTFVKQNVVNASKELDNAVLDAMEPFDWSKVIPFDFGCIAGQSVKIRNVDEEELIQRAIDEVADNIKPNVIKQLGFRDIDIICRESNKLIVSPILLPVFVINHGNIMASVNGQTGRVSVNSLKPSVKIFGYEASLLIINAIFAGFYFSKNFSEGLQIFGTMMMFSSIIVINLPHGFIPHIKKIKKVLFSKECLAIRNNNSGKLSYRYGKNLLDSSCPESFLFESNNIAKKPIIFKIDHQQSITLYWIIYTFLPLFSIVFVYIFLQITNIGTNVFPYVKGWIVFQMIWLFLAFAGDVIILSGSKERYKTAKHISKGNFIIYRNRYSSVAFFLLFPIVLLVSYYTSNYAYRAASDSIRKVKEEDIKQTKFLPFLKHANTSFFYANNNNLEICLNNKFIEDSSHQYYYELSLFDNKKLKEILLTGKKVYCVNGVLCNKNKVFYENSEKKVVFDYKSLSMYNHAFKEKEVNLDNKNIEDNLIWNIDYSEDKITILKGIKKEIEYKIVKEELDNKDCYVLKDKNDIKLGISSYNKENKSLEIFKIEPNGKILKAFYSYSIIGSYKVKYKKIYAFPIMLVADDIDEISRYAMFIEISKLE